MHLLDPRARAVAAVAAFALLFAPPCLAQTNLVTNESFDTNVLGWEAVEDFMSISFDADDVDGSADRR